MPTRDPPDGVVGVGKEPLLHHSVLSSTVLDKEPVGQHACKLHCTTIGRHALDTPSLLSVTLQLSRLLGLLQYLLHLTWSTVSANKVHRTTFAPESPCAFQVVIANTASLYHNELASLCVLACKRKACTSCCKSSATRTMRSSSAVTWQNSLSRSTSRRITKSIDPMRL